MPMRTMVSIVIPAWNEAEQIGETLRALCMAKDDDGWWDELIVVDDGSDDETAAIATQWADRVITNGRNLGKGAALQRGCEVARHPIIMLLDADLGYSAKYAKRLLSPLIRESAHMSIAVFPKPHKKAGFGVVKRVASLGIFWLSGYRTRAPLSGQRAMRKEVAEQMNCFAHRFGVEVGLTIDVVRRGFAISEVEVPFEHREYGRDWQGFVHRGKQFIAVCTTLLDRWLDHWLDPTC